MHARPVECETLKCENPRHLGVDPVRIRPQTAQATDGESHTRNELVDYGSQVAWCHDCYARVGIITMAPPPPALFS